VFYESRGGPTPKEPFSGFTSHRKWQPLGYVSQWGGMEIGSEMLYPVSVVDGMVHQLGGWPLRFEIEKLPAYDHDKRIKCPLGEAVVTSSCSRYFKLSSRLYQEYSYIVHTSPPFFNHCHTGDPSKVLRLCYRDSLTKASDLTDTSTERVAVAVPLLGAGARGFPVEVAAEIAASETVHWFRERSKKTANASKMRMAFGIPDKNTAELLVSKLMKFEDV
jgi:O-acetyl-ADP-ribose deacetylase (regulator of RNase III)